MFLRYSLEKVSPYIPASESKVTSRGWLNISLGIPKFSPEVAKSHPDPLLAIG